MREVRDQQRRAKEEEERRMDALFAEQELQAKKAGVFSRRSARLLSQKTLASLNPTSIRQMPRSVPLPSAPGGRIRRPCWPRRPTFSGDFRQSAEVHLDYC
jgi:hypothetical protein